MSIESIPDSLTDTESSVPAPLSPQQRIEQIVDWMTLFVSPGQVVELRALGVQHRYGGPHTESGFFDYEHLLDFAKAAYRLSPFAKGVYFTLNPLNNDLLARRANRVDYAKEGELAKDRDVLERRWLLIDVDPERDTHISATDNERKAAAEVGDQVLQHLQSLGWPRPIVGDSGNGFHLYYPIELPAADENDVDRVLQALGHQFNTPAAKVDGTVFNPSRISKVPGTMARKGDSTKDRPHRLARIIKVPSS